MNIFDELTAMRIKLQSWADLQYDGLEYDAKTTYCPFCQEDREEYGDDWEDDCTHDPSTYLDDQTKEYDAVNSVMDVVKAIKASLVHFNDFGQPIEVEE